MIEYTTLEEARAAIDGADGTQLLDQTVHVDFAFVRPPPGKGNARGANGPALGGGGGSGAARGSNRGARSGRSRSRSPGAAKEERD